VLTISGATRAGSAVPVAGVQRRMTSIDNPLALRYIADEASDIAGTALKACARVTPPVRKVAVNLGAAATVPTTID